MALEYTEKTYIKNKLQEFNLRFSSEGDKSNFYLILQFLGDLINNLKYVINDGLILRNNTLFENNKKIQLEIVNEIKTLINNSKKIDNYNDNNILNLVIGTVLNFSEEEINKDNSKYIENYNFINLLKNSNNSLIKNYKNIFILILLLIINIKNSWKGKYILSNDELLESNKKIQIFYIDEIIKKISISNFDENYTDNFWDLTDYL